MSLLIRAMQHEDLDAVLGIGAALPHAPQWPRSAYEAALDEYKAAVENATTPRRIALVAEAAEGQVAGYAVLSLVPPEAELETIAVAKQHQRRGVARELVQALLERASTYGCTQIFLEVRASNQAAQTLYGSAGFEVAGRRSGYYVEPAEDALLYRKQVFTPRK
jgi:ribosomal-protein-alanine N-acetyltransferase